MESPQFLSEPPPDHFCPVCMEVLTEPYLTDCGHHLCYTCRERLLASGKVECPECRKHNVLADARLNNHLKRQVNSLKVRCQHYEVGCQWVGELMYLQEHLDPVLKKCGSILLACPLGCVERVRSSTIKDHMLSSCRKRPYECEFCGYYNKFDIVTEQHYPLCELFLVECPNVCSIEKLKRLELVSHLEQCPFQVIQCPFTSAGCTVELSRREMEEHEKNALSMNLPSNGDDFNKTKSWKQLRPQLSHSCGRPFTISLQLRISMSDFADERPFLAGHRILPP